MKPKVDPLVQPTGLSMPEASKSETAAAVVVEPSRMETGPTDFVPLPDKTERLTRPFSKQSSELRPVAPPVLIAPRPICRPREPEDTFPKNASSSPPDSIGFKPIPKAAPKSVSPHSQLPQPASELPPLRKPVSRKAETTFMPPPSAQIKKQNVEPENSVKVPVPAKAVSSSNSDIKTTDRSSLATEKKEHHTVADGDSLWSIANQYYGDGQYFRALHAYNDEGIGADELLTPGTKIAIPDVSTLNSRWPELCPALPKTDNITDDNDLKSIEFVTRPGDTLFDISRDRLGQASRYVEIMSLNRNRIRPTTESTTPLRGGIRLQLPVE